jgi:hypothetical protein
VKHLRTVADLSWEDDIKIDLPQVEIRGRLL